MSIEQLALEVIPGELRLSTSAKISGAPEREHQEIIEGFNVLNRNERIKIVYTDSKAEFPDAKHCVSSCKEEHGDVEESNTRVDQLSQDVTGSNPSVSNPCGDVTGPESLYQRPGDSLPSKEEQNIEVESEPLLTKEFQVQVEETEKTSNWKKIVNNKNPWIFWIALSVIISLGLIIILGFGLGFGLKQKSEPVNTHADFASTSPTPPSPTSDEPKGEVTTQMKISCDRLTMKAENIAHTAKCNSTAKRKWKKQSCVYDKNCQNWNLTTQEDPYKNRHCCPILTMNGTSEGLLKFAPQNSSDCPSCGRE